MNIQHTASTSVCQSQSALFPDIPAGCKAKTLNSVTDSSSHAHLGLLGALTVLYTKVTAGMQGGQVECLCVLCNNTALNRKTETQGEEGPAGNHPQDEYKPAYWRDGKHKAPVAALQPHPSTPLLRFHIRGPHTG